MLRNGGNMIFSSVQFLYWFLPIVILLYFAVPWKLKNAVLLLASLAFYFFGEPVYTFLMLGSAFIGYLHGLIIDKVRGTKWAKVALVSSLVFGLGALGFFKYSNFFITNINDLFHSELGLLSLSLPIGISFYTFQILSYTIDVYRNEAKVQKNPISFMAYVTLFPQLIAGPIVRYQTVQDELDSRKHTLEDFSAGVTRFCVGLGKKILIADALFELIKILSEQEERSVLSYWLCAIAFMLQIYFDFSGYSDMAIGLGRLFGFHFLENFNYPYISQSIAEFWRRWHMSLGTWFRDYVYIPLGGNRCSKGRWFFNVLVVWFLTGFWHGASWNFIIWGLYFALFLLLEKLFLDKLLQKLPRALRTVYVLFFINISFVIFNADSMKEALKNLGGMVGAGGIALTDEKTLYYLISYAGLLLIAAVLATPLMKWIGRKLKESKIGAKVMLVLEPVFVILVILMATGFMVDGSFSPFLYFRF